MREHGVTKDDGANSAPRIDGRAEFVERGATSTSQRDEEQAKRPELTGSGRIQCCFTEQLIESTRRERRAGLVWNWRRSRHHRDTLVEFKRKKNKRLATVRKRCFIAE